MFRLNSGGEGEEEEAEKNLIYISLTSLLIGIGYYRALHPMEGLRKSMRIGPKVTKSQNWIQDGRGPLLLLGALLLI